MTETTVPSLYVLVWPVIRALRELGGSGIIAEIDEKVTELEGFTEAQQQVPATRGNRSKIEFRLGWARTLAKNIGLLENTATGVWALTKDGNAVTREEVEERKKRYRRDRAAQRKGRAQPTDDDIEGEDLALVEEEPAWQAQALDVLRSMDPIAFERLAQLLLRAAKFINVKVTQRSSDGGIDGTATYRPSLVSFRVAFQCKRYSGAVGSAQVRDFRGAMIGRGEMGLFITTGRFTQDARAESARAGAPPLDLIDGDDLVGLLKEYKLGISTELVEKVTVHPAYFDAV